MKQTVRCTKLFCTCTTPIRACRHSVVETSRQIFGGADHVEAIRQTVEADLAGTTTIIEQAAPSPQVADNGVPASGLPLKGGAETPDFAIPLAEKAQAMIAAFDLLPDEAWASLPEPVWQQIQSAADHLQLAIFNYRTKGAQA